MASCSRKPANEFVEFEKNYDFHDLPKDDARRNPPLVPPEVEVLKPAPGTKVHPKDPIDILVRIRLVPGSRIPAYVFFNVDGEPGSSGVMPTPRFRKDGDDYLAEGTVRPTRAWKNNSRGHLQVVVAITDVMTVWDGQEPKVKQTRWTTPPVLIEALSE
jgi:hypothetical protein